MAHIEFDATYRAVTLLTELDDFVDRPIAGRFHRAHLARTLGREGNGEVLPRFWLAGLALAIPDIRDRITAPPARRDA